MADFAEVVRLLMAERGMSLRGLGRAASYDPSYLSKVLAGQKPATPYLAARLDEALAAEGKITEAAASDQAAPRPRRSASRRKTSRAAEALETITSSGDPGGMDIAADGLAGLVAHYSRMVAMTPSLAVYDELLGVRSYAGSLLGRVPARQRPDLTVAAGWLSGLLAVTATDLGDHAAAVVWCADAERRGRDAGFGELAGWTALTRSLIAYYQGDAARAAVLARCGFDAAPSGSAVRVRLAAQEMRSRAMLGDTAGMVQARRWAAAAMEQLEPGIGPGGVFSVPADSDPPYVATSLLLAGRHAEAAAVTRRIIGTVYQPQPPGGQPARYARTLLILALAAAGLGEIDEAAAAGNAALEHGPAAWPTMVLAARLSHSLTERAPGSCHAAGYQARLAEAREQLALPAARTGSLA